ncbi:MAG: CheY-like chemotaxis protein [Myxococcota bacterium]|jgi:CheY-like chemotaxis protein
MVSLAYSPAPARENRVLVVEDDECQSILMERWLSNCGYCVTVAKTTAGHPSALSSRSEHTQTTLRSAVAGFWFVTARPVIVLRF